MNVQTSPIEGELKEYTEGDYKQCANDKATREHAVPKLHPNCRVVSCMVLPADFDNVDKAPQPRRLASCITMLYTRPISISTPVLALVCERRSLSPVNVASGPKNTSPAATKQ
eukprot:892369-Amphidinium_carterae.1